MPIILARYEGIPLPDFAMAESWLAPVFLVATGILAWIKNSYPNRFERLFKSALNVRMMRQTMREESAFTHRASTLLFILFVLTSGVILYRAHMYLGWTSISLKGISLFAAYCTIVLIVYGFKTAVAEGINAWSEGDFNMGEYVYSMFVFVKVAGILLLFPALILAYGNPEFALPTLLVSACVFGIILILRTLRGMQAALEAGINPVYIILYLCGLEIMPFAVFLVLLLRH